MEAVWLPRLGGSEVLEIVQRPVPKPGPNEVLVRVHASSINPRDTLIRAGRYPFQPLIRLPIIPGSDLAGTVVERGRGVTSLALGQPVFGMQPSRRGFGADAAGIPLAALTALQALRDRAGLRPGQRLLILGASGGVGTYGVQIGCLLGGHVTAVCSGRNTELVRSLGAQRVFDYQQVDVLDVETLDGGRPYDVIFDVVGQQSLARCRHLLAEGGVYVTTIPRGRQAWEWVRSTLGRPFGLVDQGSTVVLVRADGGDMRQLAAWAKEGRLRTVIERIFPLDQVAAAHEMSQSRRSRGKLILRLEPDDRS